MTFRKTKVAGGPTYGGNINIWLNKSKEMSEDELATMAEAHPVQMPRHVMVLVVDADQAAQFGLILADGPKGKPGVLYAAMLEMDEFSSGAIGYKCRLNRETFTE